MTESLPNGYLDLVKAYNTPVGASVNVMGIIVDAMQAAKTNRGTGMLNSNSQRDRS